MLLGAYGRGKSRVDHTMLRLAVREVLGEQASDNTMWRWLGVGVAAWAWVRTRVP